MRNFLSNLAADLRPFGDRIAETVERFLELSASTVVLIHHNDTDGLTAGAILCKTMERLGKSVRRYCLEKPYPLAIERIFEGYEAEDSCYVLTDFGSGMVRELVRLNRAGKPLFILDHHAIEDPAHGNVQLLNCRAYGISGDYDCSAGTIAALFAEAAQEFTQDMAMLGLLGAFGDRQVRSDGSCAGVNAFLAGLAAERGQTRLGSEGLELHLADGQWYAASQLNRWVDALGAFGYLRGGPDVAIKGLLEGFDQRYQVTAERFYVEFEQHFSKWFCVDVLKSTAHCYFFSLPQQFHTMGVKTVGLVCEKLRDNPELDSSRYIVGFQKVPAEIPGLGSVPLEGVKVSVRLGKALSKAVRAGHRIAVPALLAPATEAVGGLIDACHVEAGAVVIPPGTQERFMALVDARAAAR